jgi:hypothetical protein
MVSSLCLPWTLTWPHAFMLALALTRCPPATCLHMPCRQVLQHVVPQVQALLQGSPLLVHLKGLAIMNEDAAEAQVVYLQVRRHGAHVQQHVGLLA